MTISPAAPLSSPHIDIVRVPYDHDDATRLTARLHDEQRALYGFADEPHDTPTADFEAPHGAFLVARVDGRPVACGGWRLLDATTAEIKRMYVEPGLRGRALGHALLRRLEQLAAAAGASRVVLETGRDNTQALALYARAGYRSMPSYVPGRDPNINRALAKALPFD